MIILINKNGVSGYGYTRAFPRAKRVLGQPLILGLGFRRPAAGVRIAPAVVQGLLIIRETDPSRR